jgi:hypothetical protein
MSNALLNALLAGAMLLAVGAARPQPGHGALQQPLERQHRERSHALGQWVFTSTPADDLQPLFMEQLSGWLGADIATSVALPPAPGSDSADTASYLWLFGDTLLGTMDANGTRAVTGMPRNSVGILNVTASPYGQPAGQLGHYIRADPSQPVHVGFFTPPGGNESLWYWPTAAAAYNGTVYAFAYLEAPSDTPLFNFQTVGFHALAMSSPAPGNPLAWPAPVVSPLPHINNSFTLGNAVAVSEADGYLYLLGGSGSPQSAIVARLALPAFAALDWSQLEYWTGPAAGWQQWSGDLAPQLLFPDVPSETTLQYHPVLQQWFIVVANTFASNAINLRLAPTVTGPWSDPLPIYAIPAEYTNEAGFCYAGKSHPELMSAPNASEIVFSYMCNTPNISSLEPRPDMYVPRLVRTTFVNATTAP